MIVKIAKSDNTGWVLRDNLGKVRYDLNSWRLKLHHDATEDYSIFHSDENGRQMDLSFVDIVEIDLDEAKIDIAKQKLQINNVSGSQIPKEFTASCILICGTIGYREHNEKEILIITNKKTYLLNDNGKTIETLN